jgi:gliding motility-associated lipoprotein GldD
MKFLIFIIIFNILGLYSCTNNEVLRQKAYQRFYFPKKNYIPYASPCNFSFDIPSYSRIETKDSFQNKRLDDDSCWINVDFPDWNGKIHISYKYYDNQEMLTKLLEDSYKLTSKHMIKATYIKDSIIDTDSLKGLIYSVGGNSASEKQFVLTDYKHHFVRGALYFNSPPNYDSMRPIIEYINADIYHLIATFKFQ